MNHGEGICVLGVGSALPNRVVGNEEIERLSGIPAAQIQELFEIRERHWSRGAVSADPAPGQACSDLAAEAARRAIADAGIARSDIDLLVAVTTTPDVLNPPFDNLVAVKLGLKGVLAFFIHAPCTGIFRGTALAEAMIGSGQARIALVVVAETISPFFRFGEDVPRDHRLSTALYADGAAAWVMGGAGTSRSEVLATTLVTNSSEDPPGILLRGMMSATPPTPQRYSDMDYLGYHDFRGVLRHGGELAAQAARLTMIKAGIEPTEVRYLLTHQATGNLRRIAASHGLLAEKIPVNIHTVGNTISASILILLDELKRTGQLSTGDLLVLHTAESSSWSYAGMAIRW